MVKQYPYGGNFFWKTHDGMQRVGLVGAVDKRKLRKLLRQLLGQSVPKRDLNELIRYSFIPYVPMSMDDLVAAAQEYEDATNTDEADQTDQGRITAQTE